MTLKGGSSQACAACKYQRRKCTSECPLAAYFPPEQPKMFQNAHRLFGVSNILKIIKHMDKNQKMEAMRSIIFQADIRDRFPVHGCLGMICQLQLQIQHLEEELHAVLAQLDFFRQHHQQMINDSCSQLELGMALSLHPHHYNNNAGTAMFLSSHHNLSKEPCNFDFLKDSKDNLSRPHHSFNNNNNNNNNINNNIHVNNSIQMVPTQLAASAVQQQASQDYDGIHPFFDDSIDHDRLSYVESKAAYESSSESSPPSLDHVADNELKNAAACFSLVSLHHKR